MANFFKEYQAEIRAKKEANEVEYIVTNGDAYLYTNSSGAVRGTSDLQQARKFVSEETALAFLSSAPAKYKTYCVAFATKAAIKKVKQAKQTNQASITTANKRCPIDPMIRKYIYRQSNGKCALCGKSVKYTDFTIDHIVPLSMGGENDIDNFQCTCRACNQFKSNILPEDFIQRVSDIYKHNAEKTHKRGFKRSIVKGILSLID